ncbi:putative transposase/invertase (TIGR01784 family) [Heliophilum fasciatum]|uniref:Putative transposase/invertase (TIGR01784 family) n=1 Tax=Heliophilum fasciatum TaxID=35700 RepID=A0A4R2RQJ0_9FIRM|nr:putative transposase/invertase (TIGR01784 family) [Heliophilum fasciatum]
MLNEAELAIRAAHLAKEVQGSLQVLCVASIIAITDKILPESVKKMLLEVLRMTDIEKWLREEGREEGRVEGRMEGRVEGREEGREEGKEMVAIAALKEGLPPETVARFTGIPIDKIRKIASTHLPQ